MGLLESVQADLSKHCEGLLATTSTDGGVTIKGGHPVCDIDGNEITRYAIRIDIPADFPKHLPLVYDAADRFPRFAEWHMFPNGRCCIGVPAALIDRLGWNYKISDFINGPMHDYFVGQACFEAGLGWPYGAMEHNEVGLLDYWQEKFEVSSHAQALGLLRLASKDKPFRRQASCPCGSKLRIRLCHGDEIKGIRVRFGLEILFVDVKVIDRLQKRTLEGLQSQKQSENSVPGYLS